MRKSFKPGDLVKIYNDGGPGSSYSYAIVLETGLRADLVKIVLSKSGLAEGLSEADRTYFAAPEELRLVKDNSGEVANFAFLLANP